MFLSIITGYKKGFCLWLRGDMPPKRKAKVHLSLDQKKALITTPPLVTGDPLITGFCRGQMTGY